MNEFSTLVKDAFSREVLNKLIFSRPKDKCDAKKVSARLCAHRGRRILAVEYSLEGNTVSQKNFKEEELPEFLSLIIGKYNQANLYTTLGDAEYKASKSGDSVILGKDKLKRKLAGDTSLFAITPSSLDNKKNRILEGNEDFLIKLGISNDSGRVHDKRQGKFRQISRFLEYVEEIYPSLQKDGELCIYDLCCGKSYLSFAVYYYLTEVKKRRVYMLGIDLKRDVMDYCNATASKLGFVGMHFICDDIKNAPKDKTPDMVISLHACDIATDIVLMNAVRLGAGIILSTPCCHKKLSDLIDCKSLDFVTKYPKLRGKLSEAITDALRLEYLAAHGYSVSATELTDPDDTPKNTLLRAIKRQDFSKEKYESYKALLKFVLGDNPSEYPLI